MKERPILMTPENAQRCFEGTKTQTRRIVKPSQLGSFGFTIPVLKDGHLSWTDEGGKKRFVIKGDCPYGKVGDLLYVRESFWCPDSKNPIPHDSPYMFYRGNQRDTRAKGVSWKPSIHMPRWACRTVLRLTDVRVERLQEISEEDARAEGVEPYHTMPTGCPHCEAFEELWEPINGKGSWALDSWVWALTFEKVTE